MNNALSNLLEAVRSQFGQELVVEVSEPHAPTGVWFVDFAVADYVLALQHADGAGFGLTSNPDEFGSKPDEIFDDWKVASVRVAQLITTRARTIPSMTLSGLRGAQTQSAVASAMEIRQPSYAKMERNCLATFKVETLARVVEALSGRLHLLVEGVDGRCYLLHDSFETLAKPHIEAIYSHKHCISNVPLGLVAFDPFSGDHNWNRVLGCSQSGNVIHADFRPDENTSGIRSTVSSKPPTKKKPSTVKRTTDA